MPPSRPVPAPLLLAAALCIALAGCRPGTSPPTDAGDAASTDAAQGRLGGTAVYRERIVPPPGSRLQVRLIDMRQAGTPGAVLAESSVGNVGAPPISFALDYDPAAIHGDGRYGLHAVLQGPDGAELFATDVPQPVTPGREEAVELRLGRVVPEDTGPTAAHPADATDGTVERQHWQCGELRVDTAFDPATLDSTLSFSGRRLVLAQTPTATGTRHADDAGNEFRSDGDSASLTLSGRSQVECTPADAPSPWTEAAERGLAFRAVGSEPGWWVEVGSGAVPALNAVLDYGERTLEIAESSPDGDGYSGSTADGTAVRLSIERRACEDGMSGEAFEARAELAVGDRTYRGCGAFLQD